MKVIGFMIKLKGKGYILIRMEQCIKVIGGWIYSMDKDRNIGLTVQCLKENTFKVKNAEWDIISGLIIHHIRDTGLIMKYLDSDFINGPMVEDI